MWKPESPGEAVDTAGLMDGMREIQAALLNLTNMVSAQRVDMSSIAGGQRVTRWMNVACVFVGVVSFVVMCMLLYKNAE